MGRYRVHHVSGMKLIPEAVKPKINLHGDISDLPKLATQMIVDLTESLNTSNEHQFLMHILIQDEIRLLLKKNPPPPPKPPDWVVVQPPLFMLSHSVRLCKEKGYEQVLFVIHLSVALYDPIVLYYRYGCGVVFGYGIRKSIESVNIRTLFTTRYVFDEIILSGTFYFSFINRSLHFKQWDPRANKARMSGLHITILISPLEDKTIIEPMVEWTHEPYDLFYVFFFENWYEYPALLRSYFNGKPLSIPCISRHLIKLLYVDEYPHYVELKYDVSFLKSTWSSYTDVCLRNCSCLVLFCENGTARCFYLDLIGSFLHFEIVKSGYVSYVLLSINVGEDGLNLHPSLPLGFKTTLYAKEKGSMGGYTIRVLRILVLVRFLISNFLKLTSNIFFEPMVHHHSFSTPTDLLKNIDQVESIPQCIEQSTTKMDLVVMKELHIYTMLFLIEIGTRLYIGQAYTYVHEIANSSYTSNVTYVMVGLYWHIGLSPGSIYSTTLNARCNTVN